VREIPTPTSNTVSVIIPSFNRADLVGEAIETVLIQQVPSLELIVIDDGSTDSTAEVVSSYGTDVHYHYQPNGGIAQARNAGVAASSGALLAFLDSDDLWTSTKLVTQLAVMEADEQLEAVFGHVEQFYAPEMDADFRLRHPIKRRVCPAFLSSAMLIRRAAFDRVGGFNSMLDRGLDIDWYLRARELDLRTHMLPDIVYRRRIHATNGGLTEAKEANRSRVLALKRSLDRRRAKSARETTEEPLEQSHTGQSTEGVLL
jgi:glycosyltransferase involved in cell wall biosynthesis